MTQTPPETPDPTTAEAGDTAEGERIVVLTPEGMGVAEPSSDDRSQPTSSSSRPRSYASPR